ncbi:MAG: hypothetical protein JNL42_19960, partial [Anaerolineae bacterium]|nr:hypothetical protein [Anaerolineae bacterium]
MDLSRLLTQRLYGWLLLIAGGAAVFLLQPRLPIRFSDFLLPTASIGLVIAAWWWSRAPGQPPTRQDALAAALLIGVVLLLALNRYLPDTSRITPSRPPDLGALIAGTAAAAAGAAALWRVLRGVSISRRAAVLILILVGLFVILKTEPLARALSAAWRSATG